MAKDLGKSSTGLEPSIAAFLSYLLGLISGIIFFVIEKENRFVRFHAMQSIITFGFLFVLQVALPFVPFVGWVLLPFVSLLSLVLWILLMYKAFKGEAFKLPIIGDMAEQKI